jgi:hypothetical protein
MIESARGAIRPLFWPAITEQLVRLYRSELGRLEQTLAS